MTALTRPARTEPCLFSSGKIALEGVLSFPEDPVPSPGVVLCHPHPLYGGDMNNNVIVGIGDVLVRSGFVVLRFNFRGVNGSEGEYGEGEKEVNDVLAAVEFLRRRREVRDSRLFLVGYSFGAWVASRVVPQTGDLRALAVVAPPLNVYEFDRYPIFPAPVLFICGDRDDYCDGEKFISYYYKIDGPKEKVILKETDHFFWGKEGMAGEAVSRFFLGYR